jgi:hypothetical protein
MTPDELIEREAAKVVHRKPHSSYAKRTVRGHPRAAKNGQVLLSVLIAEAKIGRYLTSDEEVHHINGIKNDDRPENLLVLSHAEHCKRHYEQGDLYRFLVHSGKPQNKKHCPYGHEYTPENTYIGTGGYKQCRICRSSNERRGSIEWLAKVKPLPGEGVCK